MPCIMRTGPCKYNRSTRVILRQYLTRAARVELRGLHQVKKRLQHLLTVVSDNYLMLFISQQLSTSDIVILKATEEMLRSLRASLVREAV